MFWIIVGVIAVALVIWATIDYVAWERLLEGKWPQRVYRGRRN